jgi:hypothetical protein
MEALRRSVGATEPAKKSRKKATKQREMLLPIEGNKPKAAVKKTSKPQRRTA